MMCLTINSLLLLVIVAAVTARSATLNPEDVCLCERTSGGPVCGSDRKTYASECELDCESKKLKSGSLRVVSHLSCEYFMKQAISCECNLMTKPVCGSDGKTYSDPCELNCESKKFPAGVLTIVSHSSCEELHKNGPETVTGRGLCNTLNSVPKVLQLEVSIQKA